MNTSNPVCSISSFANTWRFLTLLGLLLVTGDLQAGTASWVSVTDTNWSNGANWSGGTGSSDVPGPGDTVIFGNTGSATTIAGISNVVDSTSGNFGGYISALAYTNLTANSYQNTLIAPGVTLNVTNNTGPFGSALFVGTPGGAAGGSMFASISGPGATLNIDNTNAVISISQADSSSTLATLIMTNLDTFDANISKIAIGDYFFGIGTAAAQGSLFLAKTNTIITAWAGNYSTPYSVTLTNAIQLGVGSSSTLGGINALFLGLTNGIFTDSIGVGGIKSGGSATSPTLIAFAPVFTNSSPTAYFRGINGNDSRITLWGVGDTAVGSGSSAAAFGKVDLSFGTVDVMVNTMILARDRNGTAATDSGVFTFTAGNVNINTLIAGDQASASTGSACSGAMNVSGANAVLAVNTALELGITTLTGGPANALNTRGVLSVTNGTVFANNVIVGASSITNIINLINGSLTVANTLATNAAGLFTLNLSNSTLGLTVPANGSLFGLVQTLNTTGTTNLVQLNAAPVIFPSYPQQFPLIKYSTWTGSNTFGLASIPVWAPGATLVSNGPNGSLDLSLPTDPRPVFTAQPSPYSGSPGDNVTTNFSVSIAAGSVTPLGYQWYDVVGGVTNLLANGPGPSGSSTFSGVTSTNLQIANAQPGDSASYFVVATNAFGTNTSSQATLIISAGAIPPAVTGPATLTATNGITTAIINSASGAPIPVLYWQFNGAKLTDGPGPSGSSTISGTSSSTLTIINPQYPGDQGTYSLIASNSAALATNSTVLTVIVPPLITTQPVSVVVTNSQTASLTVVASGVPAPTYQWNKNGTPISSAVNNSATNATFTIASVSSSDTSTNYSVTVSNPAGTTNSVSVTLIVNSTMATTAFSPANGATGVCYDTPLYVTFNTAPVLRNAGTIKIYNAANATTPVDTINLGLNSGGVQARSPFPGDSQGFNYYPVIITGDTAAIYPHSGVMTSNQTYYVTIDDGVFSDTNGAYFAGITANSTWQFTTKVGGPANPTNVVVAQDDSGDFATVQGAVDSVPAANTTPTLINVKNGNYVEIVDISGKNDLTLRGQSRAATIVGYPNNALIATGGGSTHSRMAFKVNANDIALDNLTVTNSTSQDLAQAEALMIETGAARIIVNNCSIDSYQDTILANTSTSKAYFKNSLVQGDVDFIWGGGNLFFTNCEIRWLIRSGNSAALGPNPSPTATDINSNGFSFVNCALTSLPGANPNDVVGRTRSITNGNTALINCFITTNLGGWFSDAAPVTEFRNWYYGCTNDFGVPVTLSNGIALLASDPNVTLAGSAVTWLYGWQPQLAPNILTNPASQAAVIGSPATFTVMATGIPDPTYQWIENTTNIPNATNASFIITSTTTNDVGSYSVIVTTPAGSVTSSSATLAVNPHNPPAFTAPIPGTNITINVGVNLSVACTATDPNTPALALTFSLLSGPPGAAVDPDAGTFTWRPTVSQANSANPISVVVSDNGVPSLNATNNFTVTINPLTAPALGSPVYAGGQFSISITGQTGPDYALQSTTNLLDGIWTTVATTNSPAASPFILTDPNALAQPVQFYRIVTGPPLP